MSKIELFSQISIDTNGPPAWLDQKDLQSLIKQDFPNFLQIESICTRSEQFAQSSLRVQVQAKFAENTSRTINYLVKTQELNNAGTLKFPRPHNFQLELHMYNKVLPALVELYKEVNKTTMFCPSSLKSQQTLSAKAPSCLYLEYLQAKGYRVANLPNGLDQIAMEAVLSKLAAYHAASARYLGLNPSHLKELSNLTLNSGSLNHIEKLKSRLQLKFQESLRANDLQAYEDKVVKISGNIETPDLKQSFNVIINSACWPNNIMCNFDAFGHVKDAVFNDFGYSTYGPAIYDLLQLLLTAPIEKTYQFDAYLKYYHDQLVANLRLLKFSGKLPTLTDLQLDLLNYGHWGFEVITEILPIVLADFENDDVEDIFKTTKYSKQIYKLLPWLENRGYFEED